MPPGQEPIVATHNLSKTYSGIRVLANIDFTLYPGEIHALVGENGAGKSTFIKLLAGAVEPDEGSRITLFGHAYERLDTATTTEMGLAVIYQDISLFPNLSVMENMFMGLGKGLFTDRAEMRTYTERALAEFGVDIDVEQRLDELSVGKQQLVAIIRAVTRDAKVIIMDEPTASLSSGEVELLMDIIASLRTRKIAIIYISHKLEEVFRVADRITVFRDGRRVATGPTGEYDTEKLITLMVGRELRFIPMQSQKPLGKTLFEVRGLTNEWVRNISFRVRENEIVGITGLVGAGRSELAQSIFGLRKLDEGTVVLHGEEIRVGGATEAIRRGIGYLPEDRHGQGLFSGQTLTWNITLTTLARMLGRGRTISAARERAAAEQSIAQLDIRPPNPDILIESMSGGNQQKGLLARWLRAEPKVLIVDEPTAGVDVGAKMEIHRLLRRLAERGVCVILISSEMSEILALSDTVLVMRGGRIIRNVPVDQVSQESILSDSLRIRARG